MRFKVIFKKFYSASFALLNAKDEDEVREIFGSKIIEKVLAI